MKKLVLALAASSAALVAASAALAAPVIGLTGDKTLVMFDSEDGKVTKSMDVTGVDRLVGIDLRPANNTLIGVTADNTIVTIDPASGAATELSKMDKPLEIGDAPVIVDFNPMADKLRYMTGTTNHRVDVDTGAVTVDGSLAYEEGDMHTGEAPNIVAAAYNNSIGKPEKTAMYDVAAANYAFDIQTTADGANTAWLVNGTKLYKVDLEKGAATEAGEISGADGEIGDIAVMPAM